MIDYKPTEILKDYDISLEKKQAVCNYMNDYYNFGINPLVTVENFLEYIKSYFPNQKFTPEPKRKTFFYIFQKDSKTIEITVEQLYKCLKKDADEIEKLISKIDYLYSVDDKFRFRRYVSHFNNFESSDFLLYLVKKINIDYFPNK